MGDSLGKVFERYFYNPENDPEAQRARYYAAQTANEEEKLAAAQRATGARKTLAEDLGEYAYRGGAGAPTAPGVGATPYEIAETIPSDTPAAAPGTSRSAGSVGASALQRALAAGGDAKELTPLFQAFGLQMGNDEDIVRANAALEGKYLGANQSPSLARQDAVREDEQALEIQKHDGELRMKKYGFDLASEDRRYNTDVDASMQRRGQDVSASTQRRGQDLTDRRVRDNAREAREADGSTETRTVTTELPATKGTPAKSKFLGLFGEEKPATPGRPKTRTTVRTTTKGGAKADPLGIR